MINKVSALSTIARVWIYQSGRELSASESDELLQLGSEFVKQWASHGNALAAAFEVRYNRFAILTVDETQASASGCSIDTSVHFMQKMEQQYDTSFFDRMKLCYRTGDEVKDCKVMAIPQLIKSGELTKNTLIFDNTIQTISDLHNRWQVRMEESWAGRYFNE